MSVPKKTTESDPEFTTDETLVTDSVFKPKESLATVEAFLRAQQASGTLIVDVNRGGKTRVRFVQKQPVDVYV